MKIGVIGCGKISEKHLLAYKKMPGVRIIVADKDKEQAEHTASRMNVGRAIDIDNLFEDEDLDAVDICVPTAYHKDYILRATQSHKHVFCEKPLCLSLDEAMEIREKTEGKDNIVMVGFLYRFHSAFQFVKKVLDDGIIGQPHFAIFRLGGRGGHMLWKHDRGGGGGAVLEMLVHKLDLIVWYFQTIRDAKILVKDTVVKTREIGGSLYNVDADDLVVMELETDTMRIICESDLLSPSYMNYIEIHGDNGSIFTSILHFMPTIVFCKKAKDVYNVGNNIYNFAAENLFEKELGFFIDSIENKLPPFNSINESVKVFEILDKARIYTSR